jgi:hypothetical protein
MLTIGDGPAVVLEDDVILCRDWRSRVEAVIGEHPDVVIQFYSNRAADLTVGSRWEPGRTFLMNQCYYLPPDVALPLHAYTEHWAETSNTPTEYDRAMARWMSETKRRYWLHVPSLVQHLPWRSQIHPRRPRTRQSRTFALGGPP